MMLQIVDIVATNKKVLLQIKKRCCTANKKDAINPRDLVHVSQKKNWCSLSMQKFAS